MGTGQQAASHEVDDVGALAQDVWWQAVMGLLQTRRESLVDQEGGEAESFNVFLELLIVNSV